MPAYIAVISVINLVLGMFLARMLSSSNTIASPAPLDHDPLPTESIVETLQGTGERTAEESEHNAKIGPSSQHDSEQPTADTANNQAAPQPDPWTAIAAQLQELNDEVQVGRTSPDPQSARNAASRLRTQSATWQQQCEDALQRERSGEQSKAIASAESSPAIEALVFQIKTTLSKIDTLDFESPLEAVLDSLQAEIESLESLQKSVTNTFHQTVNADS